MSGEATRTCVDLFSGLGGFSAAFADSDEWDVFRVEIDERFDAELHADVMDLRPSDLPSPTVVVAGHPCTYFSNAGNHDKWNQSEKEPTHPDSREHVALVHHTIGLVQALTPEYWFLENPRGRMRWVLGQPTGTVTYCQYGRDYMKPTDLWGNHPPMEYRNCGRASGCHKRNVKDDGSSAVASMDRDVSERSKVPYELSEQILNAVEAALDGDAHEQTPYTRFM